MMEGWSITVEFQHPTETSIRTETYVMSECHNHISDLLESLQDSLRFGVNDRGMRITDIRQGEIVSLPDACGCCGHDVIR